MWREEQRGSLVSWHTQLDYGGCSEKMENAEDLEVLMLYWWHSRNRKGTRYWVHPINQQRRGSDVMSKLYAEERNDADAKACFIAIDVGDYMEGTTTLRFSSILVLGKQCSRMNYLCPRLSVLVMVGARSHMCSLEMKPILYSII